ncbi:MAG: SpoIIE family protein phosphatase [Methanocalculus sp.]|uniref:SpoIIE family protein phosphatase n=1 Tax=Methanocalculus sp. TaxID=2004547 RepID=UPI00272275E8|nr:SpoIIE family protein phosphatase [Methanocalculus sp.]MDO9538653.1 SpoIIE family protein phosphatase [Methanocalculus sp.]
MNLPIPPMSVRTKILIAFLFISVLSLLIAGGIASTAINNLGSSAISQSEALGNQAVEDSTAALIEDAEEYLLRIAVDSAERASLSFDATETAILTISTYAEGIRPDNTPITPPRSEEIITRGAHPAVQERTALAQMEAILVPIATAHREITWIYIGSNSGIFRIYPMTTDLDPSYDPRTRNWFQDAVKDDLIVWSRPYVDAGGKGLTVTCSYQIPNSAYNWVIGADVTIETINQMILGTNVGGDGYAMLIDSDGHVITRPGLRADDRLWDESFTTENLLESPNREIRAVTRKMVDGNTGISRIHLDKREVFISYAPVRSTGWSIAVVVPVEDVIAPALETGAKLNQQTIKTAEEINQESERAMHLFIVSMLALIGAAVVGSAVFSQAITKPLKRLSEGATAIGGGDLSFRVNTDTKDEFADLAANFNQMADDLGEMMITIEKTTAERERLSKELEIARTIQESFLPDRAPTIPGFDLSARSIPALFVGGDFYDFIPISEGRYGLVIADVSGKGVSAALFMALSRTLVRASTADEPSPASAIIHANRMIFEDSKTSMFVTLFYAILDSRERTLTYVNAGHNPPVFIRGDDASITLLKAEGIALGVLEEIQLETVTVPLHEGDLLVLYTDGVTEAENSSNDLYGEERLEELMGRIRGTTSAEIIASIIEDIRKFAGDAPQSDDITLLVMKADRSESEPGV